MQSIDKIETICPFDNQSARKSITVKSLIVTALDNKPPLNSNRTFFTYGRIEIETALV